jgi:hypothetical protein
MGIYSKNADGKYHIKGKTFELLIGTRAQVWHETAYKTSGGLKKMDLFQNDKGRIVSKSKYLTAKKEKRLLKHGYGTQKGKFGAVRVAVKSRKSRKTGGAILLGGKKRGGAILLGGDESDLMENGPKVVGEEQKVPEVVTSNVVMGEEQKVMEEEKPTGGAILLGGKKRGGAILLGGKKRGGAILLGGKTRKRGGAILL